MKKKLLTIALAATMVVSSAFGAFADTKTDLTIDGAFSANTGDEKVSGEFDVTYSFHNESDGNANWNNFVVELLDGQGQYVTVRADAAGWGAGTLKDKIDFAWEGQPQDAAGWTTWLQDTMTDADVTVNVKRTANVITLTYNMVKSSGSTDDNSSVSPSVAPGAGTTTTKSNTSDFTEYKFVGTATLKADLANDLFIHITGEKVKLTNIKYDGTKSVGTNIESNDDADNGNNTTDNGDNTTDNGDDVNQSPSSGKVEVTSVTEEVAKAISAAAKVTSKDGKALDVVLIASPVDTTVAAGLVNAKEELKAAKVKAFAVLDLKLTVDGKNVTLLDEKINVNIPMDKLFADIKADAVVAVYRIDKVNDKEQLSFLGTSKVAADKTITFATEHFSQYVFAVVENAEALKDVKVVEYVKDIDTKATPDMKVADIKVLADASVKPDDTKTGDTTPVMPLVVLAVVALGGVIVAVASKKRA